MSGRPVNAEGPLRPNPEATHDFLAWWFHDCTQGLIEVGSFVPGTRSLSVFERFGLDEVDRAAEYAARVNMHPGASMYFRASTVSANAAAGRTTDADVCQAPGFWGDHDSQASVAMLANNPLPFKPPAWIVTGTLPFMRVQSFWRLSEPLTNMDMVRDLNHRLISVFRCDTTTFNPSRLMRMPGSIAWPIKAGRSVAELTTWQRGENRPGALPLHQVEFTLPRLPAEPPRPSAGPDVAGDGGHGFTGNTPGNVGRLMAMARRPPQPGEGGHWHGVVLRLVAHWVGRGLATAEILAMAEQLTAPGYTSDHTRREMAPMIDGARRKWDAPDAPAAMDFDPETGEIFGDPPAQKTKPGRALRILTMAEVEALPPPQWLIEGLIPNQGLVVPYGPPKAGKTFIVLALALCIAAGREWEGKAVQQGAVVYIVGEGLGGFATRLAVMRHAFQIPLDAPFFVIPRAVNFRENSEVETLVKLARQAVPPGMPIALVVIDTLARAMPGVDENSAQEVGLVIMRCDAVKEKLACTVMPIHHTGKDVERGMRGSNAITGAVDASFLIQTAGKGKVRVINDNQKDGELHRPMIFSMEKVEFGFPLRSSLVPRLEREGHHEAGGPPSEDKPSIEEMRMRVLLAMNEAGLDMMRMSDVARALNAPRGRAQEELREMIPLGMEYAVQVANFLIWKSAQGDAQNAPLMVHRRPANAR